MSVEITDPQLKQLATIFSIPHENATLQAVQSKLNELGGKPVEPVVQTGSRDGEGYHGHSGLDGRDLGSV